MTVDNCWFESCYHEAMAWSEARDADVSDSVVLNCGQGIECGFGSPDVNAVRCLATGNLVGARFGDNYDWTYDGFLSVHDSLLLFNQRDVWGQAWDDWTVHLAQMDIQSNYVSVPNGNYPDNSRWDPRDQSHQIGKLEPFLPTPVTTVGIALVPKEHASNIIDLPDAIGVRLSTFTTCVVSVDYTIASDTEHLDSGTLYFLAGETLKQIGLDALPLEGVGEIHVTISHPFNAELTGLSEVTCYNAAAFIEPLIEAGDVWAYCKGTAEPPADWAAPAFDDMNWLRGATPIGYEASSGYETHIATHLSDMQTNYISVYARRAFVVDHPNRLTGLTLTVDFDDGYVAYLNGVRVAGANAPDPTTHDQPAGASHEACAGTCDPQPIDLTEYLDLLRRGRNVLAFQGHNRSLASSDFLFTPQLAASTAP